MSRFSEIPEIDSQNAFHCFSYLSLSCDAFVIDLQKVYSIKHIAIFNSDDRPLKNFEIYLSSSPLLPDFQYSNENKPKKIFTSSKEIPKNGIFSEYFDCKFSPKNNYVGEYLMIQSNQKIRICQIRVNGEIYSLYL